MEVIHRISSNKDNDLTAFISVSFIAACAMQYISIMDIEGFISPRK